VASWTVENPPLPMTSPMLYLSRISPDSAPSIFRLDDSGFFLAGALLDVLASLAAPELSAVFPVLSDFFTFFSSFFA
jgi:hypothetical protein